MKGTEHAHDRSPPSAAEHVGRRNVRSRGALLFDRTAVVGAELTDTGRFLSSAGGARCPGTGRLVRGRVSRVFGRPASLIHRVRKRLKTLPPEIPCFRADHSMPLLNSPTDADLPAGKQLDFRRDHRSLLNPAKAAKPNLRPDQQDESATLSSVNILCAGRNSGELLASRRTASRCNPKNNRWPTGRIG